MALLQYTVLALLVGAALGQYGPLPSKTGHRTTTTTEAPDSANEVLPPSPYQPPPGYRPPEPNTPQAGSPYTQPPYQPTPQSPGSPFPQPQPSSQGQPGPQVQPVPQQQPGQPGPQEPTYPQGTSPQGPQPQTSPPNSYGQPQPQAQSPPSPLSAPGQPGPQPYPQSQSPYGQPSTQSQPPSQSQPSYNQPPQPTPPQQYSSPPTPQTQPGTYGQPSPPGPQPQSGTPGKPGPQGPIGPQGQTGPQGFPSTPYQPQPQGQPPQQIPQSVVDYQQFRPPRPPQPQQFWWANPQSSPFRPGARPQALAPPRAPAQPGYAPPSPGTGCSSSQPQSSQPPLGPPNRPGFPPQPQQPIHSASQPSRPSYPQPLPAVPGQQTQPRPSSLQAGPQPSGSYPSPQLTPIPENPKPNPINPNNPFLQSSLQNPIRQESSGPICYAEAAFCVQSNLCYNGIIAEFAGNPTKKGPCSPGEVCCKTKKPITTLPGYPNQPLPRPQYATEGPVQKYTGPLNTTPPTECAAALKCVDISYCTAEGVMSETPVALTREQSENRVPLTDCQDVNTGRIGKCCRDPNYKDPWPAGMMMPKSDSGFDDGQYRPTQENKFDDGQYHPPQGQYTTEPVNPHTIKIPLGVFNQKVTPFPVGPRPGQTHSQVFPGNEDKVYGKPAPLTPHHSTGQSEQQPAYQPQQPSYQTQQPTYQPQQPSYQPYPQPPQYQTQQPQYQPPNQPQPQPQYQSPAPQTQPQYQPSQNQPQPQPQYQPQQPQTQPQQPQTQPQQPQTQPQQPQTQPPTQPTQTPYQSQPPQQSPYQPQQPYQPQTQPQPKPYSQTPSQFTPQPYQSTTPIQPQTSPQQPQDSVPQPAPIPGQECGVRREAPGTKPDEAGFGEFPWHALILSKSNNSALCSAAIIAPNAVLTAAHCIEGLKPEEMQIKAGGHNLGQDGPKPSQTRPVGAAAIHPSYNSGSLVRDEAVIVTEEPLIFDSHIDKVCLAPSGPQEYQPTGRSCYVTGYGRPALQRNSAGTPLHKVPVELIPKDQCESKLKGTHLGKYFILNEGFTCAVPPKESELCKVDVGSPLVCEKSDGKYELAGVYSWDTKCSNELPGVTASCDTQWIEQVLATPVEKLREQYIQRFTPAHTAIIIDIDSKPGFALGYGK